MLYRAVFLFEKFPYFQNSILDSNLIPSNFISSNVIHIYIYISDFIPLEDIDISRLSFYANVHPLVE